MSDTDEFQTSLLSSRATRRSYLVTYSQANLTKFPSRESFAACVVSAFNSGTGKVQVDHWACCLEEHQSSGQHYHLCMKLSGPKRWKAVKEKICADHGIVLNFSDSHDSYYYAYKYVCKSDKNVLLSDTHPNLKEVGSPTTKSCVKAYRQSRKNIIKNNRSPSLKNKNNQGKTSKKSAKIRRLSNLEVSEFLLEHTIKRETELFAIANKQKREGKKDLANFVLSRSSKSLSDIIESTWKMSNAETDLDRENKSRMHIIKEFAEKICDEQCNGEWFKCAREVLKNNNIHAYVFANALYELLTLGRGKFRNIMIVGPANCAKTFLLSPLQVIFKAFCNPANDKYAWVGADNCEVIFLNDFRWSAELIAWKDFLLLLEGQIVHLPSPKNHFAKDVCINQDTPIFATSKSEIVYSGKHNQSDYLEDDMMAARWKVFKFKHQIPEEEQKQMKPCGTCFSKLILLGQEL